MAPEDSSIPVPTRQECTHLCIQHKTHLYTNYNTPCPLLLFTPYKHSLMTTHKFTNHSSYNQYNYNKTTIALLH